ncbi:hypothetical protein UC34_13010 [Pandoraea vervacti]|uniref:Inclusion body protein n=1 Tax=Pandoraea vervacti TaxID=656178 RepID=A0ABM5SYS0_9BURK|nr:AidA/PixA family protein [Pandoraea vervacti]AJP57664.1 hypothetical protein UC34_13010 [Pandoraea vervacti]
MSDPSTCGALHDESAANVLLAIDTATLLDHPHDSPVGDAQTTAVDGSACFCLSSGADALAGVNTTTWSLDVRPGARLRLRWTPLAMRGEHAVLLHLSLADEAVLGNLQLHVDDNAVRYAPQPGTPGDAVARPAPDAFWQAQVVASGKATLTVEAIVTDRDATLLGRFGWTVRIAVP